MNKQAIVAALKKSLEADILAMSRIARDAADAATHEPAEVPSDGADPTSIPTSARPRATPMP